MKKLFGFEKKNNFNAEASEQPVADNTAMLGLSNLYSPQDNVQVHARDIADVLCEMSTIDREQLNTIRVHEKKKPDSDVERIILDSGLADARQMLQAKALLYGYKFQDIQPCDIDREMFDKLEIGYIKTNNIIPVSVVDKVLIVATSDPANVFVIDDVVRRVEMSIEVVVCPESDIIAACDEFDETKLNYDFDDIMQDMAEIEVVEEAEEDVSDLERSAAESPVIKFVNYLITNAVHEGASDIHIEPKEKFTKIRCRIDGVLFDSMEAPSKMHAAIVSRIKIMSNLDISERRVPQDGKISVIMGGRPIDLRVSVLPTSHGEKVVIRILDSRSLLRGLDNSGMEPAVKTEFERQIAMPHGILLVTGPTGSGKSTTLYSALGQMDGSVMNISTVENPVEYDLESCNQVQVNDRVGMTFAGALRSLLRQDPDIIMLGEIRDQETARVAVQAALTGHLVLSTLHTNDAAGSISRLINIGIEPFLIAASLNGVLAQRLIRKICPNCIEDHHMSDEMWRYVDGTGLNAEHLKHGAGCDQCRQSGYAGRAGIFELLIMDDALRGIINQGASSEMLRRAFFDSDSPTLFDDGIEKVKQGITTVEEVLRVTEAPGHQQQS